jgi:hypothetical protein
MDMKKILQALDGAAAKPVEGANDMKKFVSIIQEGANPHKVSLPVQMAMQHYQAPVVQKPAREPVIGKFFKQVEDEIVQEKAERRQLINQYASVIAERVMMKEGVDLSESTSIGSTLKAIINDIGEPITSVYDTMKAMAKKYVHDHGELKGFAIVGAGVGGRWIHSHYINRLQNELYDLCKYNPRQTASLQQFLRGVEVKGQIELKRSFSSISSELPEILAEIGDALKVPQLSKNAMRWAQNRNNYQAYLDRLEMGNDEPQAKAPKSNPIGQQNSQAETLINHILNNIPKHLAGDIRNKVARSANKLQTLQQELAQHGIQLNEAKLAELSSEKLAQYKKAAGAQASAADKAGDYEKGNKRFKGIVKATIKQGDNDAKKNEDFNPNMGPNPGFAPGPGGPGLQSNVAEDNQPDVVALDIPLLIRLFEYAREDAKTDMDLHDVAERLIAMSETGQALSMADYDKIVGAEQSVDEGRTIKPKKKTNPCWDGYQQLGMKAKGGKQVPNCVKK